MDSKHWATEVAYKNGHRSAQIEMLPLLKELVAGLYIALNRYDGPSEDMLYELARKAENKIAELERKANET